MLGLFAAVPQTPSTTDDLFRLATKETESGAYADGIRDANAAAAEYAAQGDTRRRALAINLAGRAALYSGDYQTAARSFRAALAFSTSVHDDAARAEELSNLGNAHYFIGRYADAAAEYDAALAITTAHANEPWSARRRRIILVNQATLNQRLGRDEEALAIYREVQSSGSDLRPQEQAQILTNLGVLYRHLGDPIKALAAYDEARALFAREHQVDGELGVMKNRGIVLALDLGQLDAARQNFTDALDAAIKAADRREILQAQLYRGETELRLGSIDTARADFTASLALARTLNTPEEQWKALYGLGRVEMRSANTDAARNHFEQAIAVIEQIREAIRVPTLRSDFFNDKRDVYDALTNIEIGRATPDRLFDLIERSHSRAWRDRLGLTSDVTLRDVQRVLPADALLLDYWSSANGSAVISITRGRAAVKRFDLDPDTVKRLIDTLSAGPSHAQRTAAESLSKIVADIPAGVRHVIIVPDGALALVPFEALPAGGSLLIEKAAVSYVPTAAMLFRAHRPQRSTAPPWTPMLRAFADPIGKGARLASSADEARSIAQELGGRSELHLGADDRKTYLSDVTAPAPLLHIASHAIADANALERSRILFSPDDDLFLREAYELPLRGVELAVLSACDTERGRLMRGEGVQSFSRAFLAAGAQTTLTTLWRVPDAPTASFMKVFYHHLQRGASRDEALRQAKLRFLRSGNELSDPHYWAAFVLTGDGIRPIPRAVRWMTVALIAAVALVIVLAAIMFRRGRSTSRPTAASTHASSR